MALVKYKILQASINDGVSYIPEKAMPLGIWTLQEPVESGGEFQPGTVPPVQYKVNLAFMMTYTDWAEEFPEEALKETQARVPIHDAEVVKDGREGGAPDA